MTKKIPSIDKKTALVVAMILLMISIPTVLFARHYYAYQGTSFPGIFLNEKSYTGMSQDDARKDLENSIAERYKDGMRFTYQDKTFAVQLAELGVAIDTQDSIDAVFSYGHNADFLRTVRQQLSLAGSSIYFQNELTDNGSLISAERWKEISAIETPAQDFSYKYDNGSFTPVEAKEGFIIDQDRLRRDIESNLKELKDDPIVLELKKDTPEAFEDINQRALKKASNLLTYQVTLTDKDSSWDVPKEDLGSWIGFAAKKDAQGKTTLSPSPELGAIQDYLVSIVPQVNRPAVNAQLEFKDGKVSVFALSQDGTDLDLEGSAKKIGESLFQDAYFDVASGQNQGANGSKDTIIASSSGPVKIPLIIKTVRPELTTDTIDNMGITSLLATGESDFHGSTKSRVHNVTVGASKFNGALVGPGDTFSFNSILGEVNAQAGYLPELVIKQGKTIPEYGGGLCQVSSTAFRAAVKAGMKITERKNHAYAVKYYAPQGTDATIYPPHPDLAFTNNTPNYILIQTRISGTKLYFDFYGTNDGRKVETEGPVVYERGEGGAMKTWWKQKVYDKDGKLTFEDTFYSNYKSASLYPTKTNPLE